MWLIFLVARSLITIESINDESIMHSSNISNINNESINQSLNLLTIEYSIDSNKLLSKSNHLTLNTVRLEELIDIYEYLQSINVDQQYLQSFAKESLLLFPFSSTFGSNDVKSINQQSNEKTINNNNNIEETNEWLMNWLMDGWLIDR